MFEVQNGNRLLRFEGRILAESDSWRRGASRWIEFTLYKTEGGSYVLSRVGVSLIYHTASCPLVARYGLHEMPSDELEAEAVGCEECTPSGAEPLVFPEEYRYWTLVSEGAQAVVDALYQQDRQGSKYLTRVAERLLQEAAAQDPGVDLVYRFEYID